MRERTRTNIVVNRLKDRRGGQVKLPGTVEYWTGDKRLDSVTVRQTGQPSRIDRQDKQAG